MQCDALNTGIQLVGGTHHCHAAGGRYSPQSAQRLVIVDVCWADGGNHGSLGVPSQAILKQPTNTQGEGGE